MWVLLTIGFELLLGWVLGLGWARILEDYDLPHGGLMPLGLLFMLCAPWLAMPRRGTCLADPGVPRPNAHAGR